MDNYKLNKNKYTPFRGQEFLRMGPIGCHETSVRNYHYPLHNNPEECSYHLLLGGSLKPHQVKTFVYSRGFSLQKVATIVTLIIRLHILSLCL